MNHIVRGSVADIARQTGQSIATTFLSVDCVVLVDTSGSMGSRDSTEGRSRYEVACAELETLQNNFPGKIGVISFNDTPTFCPNGVPLQPHLGTGIAAALKFAKIADLPGGMKFVLISDGMPDDPNAALNIARTYHNKIDVIYVGPESHPTGRDFLERLAKASGGQTLTADRVKGLAHSVQRLLTAA